MEFKKIIKSELPNFDERHWSFVKNIQFKENNFFLKISRTERGLPINDSIKSKSSIKLAQQEMKNHKILENLKYTDGFKLTPLLKYISSYNCLVYRYIGGKSLYHLTLKNNFITNKKLQEIFYTIGKNLNLIHKHFKTDNIYSISSEGFEIRNFLLNDEGIYYFDVGKIKKSLIYKDIARFIVTCYIIYWNKPLFIFRLKTNQNYINSFLKGYGINQDNLNLNKFIYIELLKYYKWALRSLDFRIKNKILKIIIKKLYIDNFYIKEIKKCKNSIIKC